MRHPKRREITIRGGRMVSDVMKELGLNPETVIAVQGKTLLTRDAVLSDEDSIEIFSAISGGL